MWSTPAGVLAQAAAGAGATGVGVGVGVDDWVGVGDAASAPICWALASLSWRSLLHPTSDVRTSAAQIIAAPLPIPDTYFSQRRRGARTPGQNQLRTQWMTGSSRRRLLNPRSRLLDPRTKGSSVIHCSTPAGARTQTLTILSRLPLPIGLPGLTADSLARKWRLLLSRRGLRARGELLERGTRLIAGDDADHVALQ
jgi:hypothetical protein